jgi:CheY-like chemotaxis protein
MNKNKYGGMKVGKILVVDDASFMRGSLKFTVEQGGYDETY